MHQTKDLDKRIVVRVSEEEHNRLWMRAKGEKLNISNYFRRMVGLDEKKVGRPAKKD